MVRKKLSVLLCAGVLLLCISPVLAWADAVTLQGDVAEQTYHYRAALAENPSYTVPEELEIDGKSWSLADVRYEKGPYHDPITVTRTVTWADGISDYTGELTETVDGEIVTLTAPVPETPVWRETTREYDSREDVPDTLEIDGETYKLVAAREEERREALTAPAEFETPVEGGRLYEFGGKLVEISGEPVWPGYEQDVAAYLGGSGYEITGAAWESESTWNGSAYVRTAVYTGWQVHSVWRAEYRQTSATMDVVYVDSAYPDGWYDMAAIATYNRPEPDHSILDTALKIGAGVIVLAAAAGGIIAVLRKKRSTSDEDNEQL